ncbi:hypothetical protein TNCV_3466161 [Trichonephila clavipes]|nr:hypothetical protein TNCV_3466161 [Trichonephila clavipes]
MAVVKPKGKEGQPAPTPRRCSTGCLKYRQCVLEECESDINTTPYHNTRCRTSVAVDNAAVQHSLSHGVSRLESDHRGVADRCVTRQ